MKRFVPLAGTLAVLLPLLAQSAFAASATAMDQRILNSLAEVTSVAAESKGSVWPGFNLAFQPFAIYEKGRVAFLVNHPHPPAGFAPYTNVPAALRGRVFVHWGSVGELDRARDLSVYLAGAKVAFLPYQFLVYDNNVEPEEFLTPLFAQYTQQAFANFAEFQRVAEASQRDYPTADTENTALANVEDKILAVALTQKDPAEIAKYGRFFVAVRHARHAHLGHQLAHYESLSESMEGSMRYAETEFSAFGASARHHALPGAKWTSEQETLKMVSGRLNQPMDSEEVRKSRLSATGTALGVLMDRLGYASWKGLVTSGTPVDEAFAKAVKFNDHESASLLASAKSLFGYEKLLADAKDVTSRYPSDYKEFLKSPGTKFVVQGLSKVSDNGGKRLDMSKPGGEWLRIGSPTPPLEIDEHTLLGYRMDAFNYRRGATDLMVRETPMLFQSNNLSWPFENVTFFSADKNLRVDIDGRTLALKNGVYPFHKGLQILGSKLTLKATEGTVKVSGREVTLSIRK